MQVWVVCGLWDYEGEQVLGVFRSESAAEKFVIDDKKRSAVVPYNEYTIESFEVKE